MKRILHVLLFCVCLRIAPATAQDEPGLVERGKQGVEFVLRLLLSDHSAFLDEVERALESTDLGKDGENTVIQINTRLTTLKTGGQAHLQTLADTAVHQVGHLMNSRKFLETAADRAAAAVQWKAEQELGTYILEKFGEDAPKKADAVLKEVKWADQQLRGLRGRLARSATAADVERELRLLSRIRTTLKNTSRVLVSQVERGKEWLKKVEESGESRTDGLERIRRFRTETVEGEAAAKYIPAVVKRVRTSVHAWERAGELAVDANLKALENAKKEFDPFEQETLLEDIPSFKEVKFEDIESVVDPHEEYLKALQRQLKGR